MSTLPLAPLTMGRDGGGLDEYRREVMTELACLAWSIGADLRDGRGEVLSPFRRGRLMELSAERDAISERYALERVASEAAARVAS